MILFYDTETTGLPLFDKPSDDPAQPHIVQIAALLVDAASREVVSSIDLTIQPDGWVIPDPIVAIHGITTERAAQVGIPEALALDAFLALWRKAERRVGHNEAFDARMVRIALKRRWPDLPEPPNEWNEWKAGRSDCTMHLSAPLVPGKHKDHGKNGRGPRLTDAYHHFTGQPLEHAHTALADARACMAVYWAIKDGKAGGNG